MTARARSHLATKRPFMFIPQILHASPFLSSGANWTRAYRSRFSRLVSPVRALPCSVAFHESLLLLLLLLLLPLLRRVCRKSFLKAAGCKYNDPVVSAVVSWWQFCRACIAAGIAFPRTRATGGSWCRRRWLYCIAFPNLYYTLFSLYAEGYFTIRGSDFILDCPCGQASFVGGFVYALLRLHGP